MATPDELSPAKKIKLPSSKVGWGCAVIFVVMAVIGSIINWVEDTPEKRAARAANEAKRAQEQAMMQKLKVQREAEEKKKEQLDRRKYDAIAMTKQFVTRRLKAPKSAEFPSRSEFRVVASSDDQYLVSGYVDSQNSFGAMIRTTFICQMKVEGETWTLVDLATK